MLVSSSLRAVSVAGWRRREGGQKRGQMSNTATTTYPASCLTGARWNEDVARRETAAWCLYTRMQGLYLSILGPGLDGRS